MPGSYGGLEGLYVEVEAVRWSVVEAEVAGRRNFSGGDGLRVRLPHTPSSHREGKRLIGSISPASYCTED